MEGIGDLMRDATREDRMATQLERRGSGPPFARRLTAT
jgi:hypothetical protein